MRTSLVEHVAEYAADNNLSWSEACRQLTGVSEGLTVEGARSLQADIESREARESGTPAQVARKSGKKARKAAADAADVEYRGKAPKPADVYVDPSLAYEAKLRGEYYDPSYDYEQQLAAKGSRTIRDMVATSQGNQRNAPTLPSGEELIKKVVPPQHIYPTIKAPETLAEQTARIAVAESKFEALGYGIQRNPSRDHSGIEMPWNNAPVWTVYRGGSPFTKLMGVIQLELFVMKETREKAIADQQAVDYASKLAERAEQMRIVQAREAAIEEITAKKLRGENV
jgi:hypothetical protein